MKFCWARIAELKSGFCEITHVLFSILEFLGEDKNVTLFSNEVEWDSCFVPFDAFMVMMCPCGQSTQNCIKLVVVCYQFVSDGIKIDNSIIVVSLPFG